jgi:NAD(P)-dependent dehydrogenase (short-subunit alcohol dehydrogenase family)
VGSITQSKTIIITGANTGIGKAVAIKLATHGAQVILACRSEERGKNALEEIKAITGSKLVDLVCVDMASQSSIHKFTEEFMSKYDRLDVLIHNAANFDLTMKTPVLTEDGVETIFATNHLGPFLMTGLLIDTLKESAPSRVITVASKGLMMYPNLKIEFDNINGEKKFTPQHAYYHSKLAQVMFTYELARKLDGAGVTTNCIRVTNVALPDERLTHLPTWQQKIYKIKRKMAITPEQQAETYVHLALSIDVEDITGGYWDEKNRQVKSNAYSYDIPAQEKLWQVSEQLTHLA